MAEATSRLANRISDSDCRGKVETHLAPFISDKAYYKEKFRKTKQVTPTGECKSER